MGGGDQGSSTSAKSGLTSYGNDLCVCPQI